MFFVGFILDSISVSHRFYCFSCLKTLVWFQQCTLDNCYAGVSLFSQGSRDSQCFDKATCIHSAIFKNASLSKTIHFNETQKGICSDIHIFQINLTLQFYAKEMFAFVLFNNLTLEWFNAQLVSCVRFKELQMNDK